MTKTKERQRMEGCAAQIQQELNALGGAVDRVNDSSIMIKLHDAACGRGKKCPGHKRLLDDHLGHLRDLAEVARTLAGTIDDLVAMVDANPEEI